MDRGYLWGNIITYNIEYHMSKRKDGSWKTNLSQADTEALVIGCRKAVEHCKSWGEARNILAKKLEIHPDTMTRWHKEWLSQGIRPLWEPKVEANHPLSTGDAFDVNVETSRAQTLDEVISLCKVDTTQWESKGFTVTRRANGFGWSARFNKKKKPIDIDSLVETFAARANDYSPIKWGGKSVTPSKKADCLYVLNLQDQHLGKLAYNAEVGGGDWDIKIAERTYRETVEELISKVPQDRVEEVVVIIGSDMLQVDTDRSTTTAGTYVDSDSRLSKVFDTAAKMLTDVIEGLALRFKVRAVVVPGNHDQSTSHFLGQYVKAWFRGHPNVTVDASPRSRKYIGYGSTLVAFDHGDSTNIKDLPLVVMRENQSTIGQYKYVEVLCGHLHSEHSQDTKGIVVRVAPALCAPDRWHGANGYIGAMRRSQGLLYSKVDGLEAIYYSKTLD